MDTRQLTHFQIGTPSHHHISGPPTGGPDSPLHNEVILYWLNHPMWIPPGATPAPMLAKFKLPHARALSQLLAAFFPPILAHRRGSRSAGYPVSVFADHASIVVDASTAALSTCTIERLIDQIPRINDWLSAWAGSVARFPALDPRWGAYLGLGEAEVIAIAARIAKQVAQPEAFPITVRDYDGREAMVDIPAKARLRLPARPQAKAACKLVDVECLACVPVARTPGGKKVLVIEGASAIQARCDITVDPGAIHKTTILAPGKIVVRNEPAELPEGQPAEAGNEEEPL